MGNFHFSGSCQYLTIDMYWPLSVYFYCKSQHTTDLYTYYPRHDIGPSHAQ